jgi:hypothetical protein
MSTGPTNARSHDGEERTIQTLMPSLGVSPIWRGARGLVSHVTCLESGDSDESAPSECQIEFHAVAAADDDAVGRGDPRQGHRSIPILAPTLSFNIVASIRGTVAIER